MIEIELKTEIDRSADECWKVFGLGYANIYQWKSGMTSSDAEGGPFQDSPISSRKIKTSGLSFSEELIHFSHAGRAFTYEVVGLQFMVDSARNEWKFSEANGKATLHMHLRIQAASGFGWLLNALLRKAMTKEMGKLHQEFKHYLEEGKVHPRKAKELASST